jgi:hypothetical protein
MFSAKAETKKRGKKYSTDDGVIREINLNKNCL